MTDHVCHNCKHWAKDDIETGIGPEAALGCGICTRVKMFWDSTTWSGDFDSREFKPGHLKDLAFVQDGSDYKASLITKPQFSCNQWEIEPPTGRYAWPEEIKKIEPAAAQQVREAYREQVLKRGKIPNCPECGSCNTDWWDGSAGCLDCHTLWAIG